MKKLFALTLTLILASCGFPEYPDLSGLSPTAALEQLTSLENELDAGEAELRQDRSAPTTLSAQELALVDLANEQILSRVDEYRGRIASDRERIYQANPSLRPATPARPTATASVGNTTTSGQCGFPRAEVSDANRRLLHAEASKSPTYTVPFQTASEVVAEYNRTGAEGCTAIRQQFEGTMTSFRAALAAADNFHNGPSRGVQCDPSLTGAAGTSYCTATAIFYLAQTVSALCHEVCN